MELLNRKEFIGDMPRQYRETIRKIKQALSRTEDPEQREILADMLNDMIRARKTVVNYYEPGGRWDDEYCNLARIVGKDRVELGCPDARLVSEDF